MSYHREEKKVVTMRLSKEDDNLIKELATRQPNQECFDKKMFI